MDVLSAVFAEALEQHISVLRGRKRLNQRIFPTGKIIFLNVDYQ
jgi:hypothetical protein